MFQSDGTITGGKRIAKLAVYMTFCESTSLLKKKEAAAKEGHRPIESQS
jgi:hypothetical protein